SSISFSSVLETRLGDDLGTNSNLTGQFAVYLVSSILFLLVLQNGKRIGAFHLAALIAGAVAIFLSGSRVALIQLGLVFLVPFTRFRVIRSVSLAASFAMVIMLLAGRNGVVGAVAEIVDSPVYAHLSTFDLGSREDLNTLAWQLAADNPVF